MRFLLDTDVVSELRKGDRVDQGVRDWFDGVDGNDLALSVLVFGELHLGIHRLRQRDPQGAAQLGLWIVRLERAYRGRTLVVDTEVVEAWAALNAPRPLPVIDGLMAATAVVHGLTFVPRNEQDLRDVEVVVLNPFAT